MLLAKWQTPIKFAAPLLLILVLKIQPNWLPLLQDLHTARAASFLTTEGLLAIQDAYARQPWNASRAEAAGLAALAAGEYEYALNAVEHAARLGGWTASLHIAAGDAANGLQNTASAIKHWEQALPNDLANTALLTRLARAYEAQAQYPEAAAVLRTLVALEPSNAIAQYRFGVVMSVIDPPTAPAHLSIAAGLDPSVQPFAESLNQAVAAGLDAKDEAYMAGVVGYTLIGLREYPLAKLSLLNAVTTRPQFAEAYAYLGLAEDQLGNDGRYAYHRAIDLNPDLSLAHYLLGLHYRRSSDNEKAIASLQRAFELDPSQAAAAAEIGSAYTEMGDLISAEHWYVQAVNVAPKDVDFWILLAQFYLDNDLKVDEVGLISAQTAVQLAPDSAAAHDALGFAYYLNAKHGLAEQSLLKAIELDNRNQRAYFHLGLLYLDSRRHDLARNALETAVAIDPENAVAGLALRAMARLGSP